MSYLRPMPVKTDEETVAREVAALLLDLRAVVLRPGEPFTWASGWRAPVYCDNRVLLSDPRARRLIRDRLAEGLRGRFPDVDLVAGVATAGIAHGVLVAEVFDRPFVYVRAAAKGHGMGHRIEGRWNPGDRAAVVEDLVSTGGSSLAAVAALREAGVEVAGLGAIFTYGFGRASRAFEEAGCPWFTLTDYPHLLAEAVSRGLVDASSRNSLERWREDPEHWPS